MTSFLLTSDIHITARPRDEYRWSIWEWLSIRAKALKVDAVFILGDLTDAKDSHPARLVCRLMDEIVTWSRDSELPPLYLMMGNHDYTDPEEPFFGWLGQVHGDNVIEDVYFITKPEKLSIGAEVLAVPHQRTWERRAGWRREFDLRSGFDLVLAHQTFNGARASNGYELDGVPLATVSRKKLGCPVISGDIHVPQKIGNVWYCGSPHPVAFGDSFQPRVLHWVDGEIMSIDRETIRKDKLRLVDPEKLTKLDYGPGDKLRVFLRLKRSEFHEWETLRARIVEIAHEKGIEEIHVELEERGRRRRVTKEQEREQAIGSGDVFDAYCRDRGVGAEVGASILEIGRSFL